MKRNSTAEASDPIAIARIRRPVGLKGDCIVSPFGETLQDLSVPYDAEVGEEGNPQREAIQIIAIRSGPKGYLCRFRDFEDRTRVETLRGFLIYVERQRLPKKGKDEYYHFELEDLTVETQKGEIIGKVVEVHNYPTTDALEVSRDSGSNVVIPLKKEFVKDIDRKKARVVVNVEGLDELLS